MKNFIVFLALVFSGLFAAFVYKQNQRADRDNRPTLRVFGSSSFIASWGPGPALKANFESVCNCRVEYFDGADSTLLLQRIKSEGLSSGADLVFGLDQYDLENAQKVVSWNSVTVDSNGWYENVKSYLGKTALVPYNWSPMAFIFRASQNPELPNKFEDLLEPRFKQMIALQDPRTSSPGLQFLMWLIAVKGEDQAFQFLRQLNTQLQSYSPGWSASYGLFQKNQVLTTFSYVTSPIYHEIEESSKDYVIADFQSGHPVQVEFMGIPSNCKQCDLAQKFASMVLSPQGQKIIMEKNFMLPVLSSVTSGTAFEQVKKVKLLENQVIVDLAERERILKKWSQLRREE